jgi:hypothetical protein
MRRLPRFDYMVKLLVKAGKRPTIRGTRAGNPRFGSRPRSSFVLKPPTDWSSTMRVLLPGLLAAGLLCAGVAAAQPCAKPADISAFDIAGLKSKLMVTALTCNQQDRYNSFVQRFRADLMVQERALHAYFARAFGGGRAQHEHDDYITNLANTQSQSGIRQGTLFCQQNVGIFNEVLALQKGTELVGFAAGKALPQPIDVVACPAPTRTAQVTNGRR